MDLSNAVGSTMSPSALMTKIVFVYASTMPSAWPMALAVLAMVL
ncbi:hypothetical protein ACVBEG_26870 [Pseudomonas sp. GG8]